MRKAFFLDTVDRCKINVNKKLIFIVVENNVNENCLIKTLRIITGYDFIIQWQQEKL